MTLWCSRQGLVSQLSIAESSGFRGRLVTNIQFQFYLTNIHFFCPRVTTSEITASPDEDYGTTDSLVIFASGDAEKTVSISIIDDDEVEGEEAFEVKLELNDPAQPGVTIGDRAMTTVVIEDIEGVSTALATLTTESPSTAGKSEARCGTIVSILKSLVELMGFPGRRYFRACLHGGGGPQVGEVTHLGEVTRLSI